jgi:hypothetical protein
MVSYFFLVQAKLKIMFHHINECEVKMVEKWGIGISFTIEDGKSESGEMLTTVSRECLGKIKKIGILVSHYSNFPAYHYILLFE